MKNAILIATILSFGLSNQAIAEGRKSLKSSTKVQASIRYLKKRIHWAHGTSDLRGVTVLVTTPAVIRINFWGNDRLSGNVTLTGSQGCGDVQFAFVGQGNGFGSYDLYESAEQVGSGKPFAGISIYEGESINLEFKDMKAMTSTGKRDSCSWSLNVNTGLNFPIK